MAQPGFIDCTVVERLITNDKFDFCLCEGGFYAEVAALLRLAFPRTWKWEYKDSSRAGIY